MRIGALLAAGALLRVVLAFIVFPHQGFATDLDLFQGWAATLARVGPAHFYASAPSADYPPGYLYVLWLVGTFGVPLKLPAILADIAIALLLYREALRWRGERAGLIAAALYLFIPVTWYDSALWGQVDAIGLLVMLVALLLLIDGHPEGAAAAAVFSVLVKPQDAVVLVVVVPVLVARYLIPRGSRLRFATTAVAGSAALVLPLIPFDIERYARAPVAAIPIVGKVAGLDGLVASLAERYDVLTANAFNVWALVGPTPLATSIGRAGASWTLDSLAVGPLSAFAVGAALLATVGILVSLGLIVRHDRLAILLGFTVVAFAFYALPTRVHERYLFPAFATGALLAAAFAEAAIAYGAVGLLNVMNVHAILASPLAIGATGGRALGRGAPFGGVPRDGVPLARGAFGGGFSAMRLPFASFARDDVVVALVALGQTVAFASLVALWCFFIARSLGRMRPWSAPRSSSSLSSPSHAAMRQAPPPAGTRSRPASRRTGSRPPPSPAAPPTARDQSS